MNTINLIKKELQNSTNWSGGVTTEIAIYPHGSKYKSLDFNWRLSSATIVTEESSFTILPNVNRIIMILEGDVTLLHNKDTKIKLENFKPHSFKGNWDTKSYGKAIDFNLMLKNNYDGSVSSFSLDKGKRKILNFHKEDDLCYCNRGFYIYEGICNFILNDRELLLNSGDFISVDISEEDLLTINSLEYCKIIETYITKKSL